MAEGDGLNDLRRAMYSYTSYQGRRVTYPDTSERLWEDIVDACDKLVKLNRSLTDGKS